VYRLGAHLEVQVEYSQRGSPDQAKPLEVDTEVAVLGYHHSLGVWAGSYMRTDLTS